MSGGAYDYAYSRIEAAADRLEARAHTPLRRAFVTHLRLVARAMHAVEWQDSGDGADDEAAMRAVISPAMEAAEMAAVLRQAIADAEAALARLREVMP